MGEELDRYALVRLLAEPARAEICAALLGGEALSAGGLARASGIAPSTASEHLSRMVSAGIVSAVRQGRHRYFRLANLEVAELVEYLASGAAPRPVHSLSQERREAHLKIARTCYDHLAGVVAVELADALVDAGVVGNDEGVLHATSHTESFLVHLGVDVPNPPNSRRPLVRSCLDWTERRPHLAGRAGAALLQHLLDIGAVNRRKGTRALRLSDSGKAYVTEAFGLALP